MAYSLEGPRWDGSAYGAPATVTWSFADQNLEAELARRFSEYPDFSASITGSFRDQVRTAFAAWEAVAAIDFTEVADSLTSDIRLGRLTIDGRATSGGSTLATTTYYARGGEFITAAIAFDVDAFDSATTFYGTALHEIGHAIGLDHSDTSDDVMYASISPANSAGRFSADDLAGIRFLYGGLSGGTAGDDVLTGTAGDDVIRGGGGNDTLRGAAGNDQLFGETGDDLIQGGDGADFVSGGEGADRLFGEGGADIMFGDTGDDLVNGGSGNDRMFGGLGRDTLFGENGADSIQGEGGDDFIGAGADDDFASGGEGNDSVYGEGGADLVFGDTGDDLVNGGAGDDRLYGGQGRDTLYGEDGADQLFGEGDNDFLGAGAGDDILSGGAGTDSLHGEAGRDILYGNAGDDDLNGGAGADVFAFGRGDGRDRVADFQATGPDHDLLLFNAGVFASVQAVLAASRQQGADVVITLDADTSVTLANVQLSSLIADDFRLF